MSACLSFPHCPSCQSQKIWKDGIRQTRGGPVQRFVCRDCAFRFSETIWSSSESSGASQGVHTKLLYRGSAFLFTRQICAAQAVGAKNLAEVKSRTEEKAAGAITDNKSLLFQYSWWLKKEGYAATTVETRTKLLKILTKRGADLNNPESVKETIARQEWCNKRKLNAADAYTSFLKMTGGTWTPPRYQVEEKLPFIPAEAELDALIAGCGPKTSTFLQLLKETGMRAGEAHRLQWTDIDSESGTVRVTPEKGSKPRVFKLSNKLQGRLWALKGKYNSNRIFSKQLRTQRRLFQEQRATLARKLQNPRLSQIHFHTFRHWKATIEYHRTRDILYVMNLLGHRSIKNTLVYTHFVEFKDDEFISKVATNAEEASQLIEAAFEYVCTTPQNLMLFRKRK
jgi:integrase